MNIAKVFWSGRSQAVRLPREFRVDGDAVTIKRRGRSLILEPIDTSTEWLDRVAGPVDADFEAAALENPGQQARETIFE